MHYLLPLLSAFIGGILIQLSMPPLSSSVLTPVSLIPIFFALEKSRSSIVALTMGPAFVVGYFISSIPAFSAWGEQLMFAPVVIYSVLFCLLFFFVAYIHRSCVKARHLGLVFGLGWIFLGYLCELLSLPKPTLSLGWAISNRDLIQASSFIGASGIDILIIFSNYYIAHLVLNRKASDLVGTLVCTTLLTLITNFDHCFIRDEISTQRNVSLIQASIKPRAYEEAKWSMYVRSKNEDLIDNLLREALIDEPNILVIPEGGNGLYSQRIQRRRSAISDILSDRETHLLFSGADTIDGNESNVIYHFHSDDLLKTVGKSKLIPFAESRLSNGQPGVVNLEGAALGIAICYESLFSSHFRLLNNEGAGAVLVVTNDTVFSGSYMENWHLAYSVYRAVENGINLIFHSNGGLTAFVSKYGDLKLSNSETSGVGVISGNLEFSNERSFYSRAYWLFDVLPAIAFVAILIAAIIKKEEATLRTVDVKKILVVNVSIIPFLLLFSLFIFYRSVDQNSPKHPNFAAYLSSMTDSGEPVIDHFSELYTQSETNLCGAASLAFALGTLGENLFEHDVAQYLGSPADEGYSMLDLKRFAQSRGFTAIGYRDIELLENASHTNPIIAHLKRGHFVVALNATDSAVVVFDPEFGSISEVPRKVLESQMSGNMLLISPS